MSQTQIDATEVATPELLKKSIKVTIKAPLFVFPTKTLQAKKPARMKSGTEVILDFLAATAESGNQLVRVRKEGSTRTFYTTNAFVKEIL